MLEQLKDADLKIETMQQQLEEAMQERQKIAGGCVEEIIKKLANGRTIMPSASVSWLRTESKYITFTIALSFYKDYSEITKELLQASDHERIFIFEGFEAELEKDPSWMNSDPRIRFRFDNLDKFVDFVKTNNMKVDFSALNNEIDQLLVKQRFIVKAVNKLS